MFKYINMICEKRSSCKIKSFRTRLLRRERNSTQSSWHFHIWWASNELLSCLRKEKKPFEKRIKLFHYECYLLHSCNRWQCAIEILNITIGWVRGLFFFFFFPFLPLVSSSIQLLHVFIRNTILLFVSIQIISRSPLACYLISIWKKKAKTNRSLLKRQPEIDSALQQLALSHRGLSYAR